MADQKVDPFQTNMAGRRVLPSFSLAERDRRYGCVRQLMAEQHLDCLLVPFSEVGETQANSRYLSQIGGVQGGAWVVFPASGEVTAVVMAQREKVMWDANLEWPGDIRWGTFSELVPDRVKELELDRGQIGVVGLINQSARPEGIIPHETWRRITERLPEATFVPANDVLELARLVKGPEEVAVVQRITDANEAAIERMMEVARPGVEESTVWLAMAEVLMRHTADYPARLSLGSNGRPANASNTIGLPIAMEDGGVLNQEVDARLQGYRAQCNHSILVGTKDADKYAGAMKAAIEVFLGLVDWVAPGKTIGQFLQEYARLAHANRGEEEGVVIHTNGLGSDWPRVGVGRLAHSQDMVIQSGWTFTIKTDVRMKATGVMAMAGEPITVSERGARRLGHRELKPFITG